ncbi:MAG: fasciclin domain-containing protein [Propionicimonas sp.]
MNLKAAAAAGVSALLILSGCSSTGDDSSTTTSESASASSAMPEPGTIAEVASANSEFSTLVAAVSAAGLVETLSGTGPYTVFAPTNSAFEALPEGLVETLLKPENKEALTSILTYHVVPGEVTSDQIVPGDVKTVEGSTLTISTDGGGVSVNDAKVTTADVDASNGVIHVIDKVLVPESVDPAELK